VVCKDALSLHRVQNAYPGLGPPAKILLLLNETVSKSTGRDCLTREEIIQPEAYWHRIC